MATATKNITSRITMNLKENKVIDGIEYSLYEDSKWGCIVVTDLDSGLEAERKVGTSQDKTRALYIETIRIAAKIAA